MNYAHPIIACLFLRERVYTSIYALGTTYMGGAIESTKFFCHLPQNSASNTQKLLQPKIADVIPAFGKDSNKEEND